MITVQLWQLRQRQALPLEAKIIHAQNVIREWYEYWNGQVYVSFSGGKDSTVLLHLVKSMYPRVPAVFCDTGLEYPEIRSFVKTFNNVVSLRPEMSFLEVIKNYGYPVVSKEVSLRIYYAKKGSKWAINALNGLDTKGEESEYKKRYKKWQYLVNAPFKVSDRCCKIMKEKPLRQYEKENNEFPFIGTLADESKRRLDAYLATGCNVYNQVKSSKPLSIWTEQDILQYLKRNKISIAKVYGDIISAEIMSDGTYQQSMFGGDLITTGCKRTGCMFCMFGVHLEKGENRFQRMKRTHPKIHDYCINRLGCGEVLKYIGVEVG